MPGVLPRMNRAVAVGTETHDCCLECSQSDDPRGCSGEPKTVIRIYTEYRQRFLDYLTRYSTAITVLKIAGGWFRVKGILLIHHINQ